MSVTCVPTVFCLTVLSYLGPFRIESRNPARPTAEWRIHEICISHRLWAQDDSIWRFRVSRSWVGQKSWDWSSISKNGLGQRSPRRIELDRNIGTDPYQIPVFDERVLGDDYQNPITEGTKKIEQINVDMPYVQSRIHSAYDSVDSIADSKFALRQASIRGKNVSSLGKIQVESPHQRSPYAMTFEDRSHEETERQQRCVQSKAWNLAKKNTSSKKKTKLHSGRPRKSGYTDCVNKKSRRKESLWRIPELVCIWSVSESFTLLSWRPWGHRGVRRRWWRPTTRCK